MLGRRSLQPKLHPLDPELERTLRTNQVKTMDPNHEGEPPHQLREYFTLSSYTYSPCIQVPPMEAIHYEIKSSIIQMLPSYYGLNNEDLYKHLNEFLEIYSIVNI